MTILNMTYQQAVQSLSLFFRQHGMSDTEKFDETPAGRLFKALCEESGDFGSKGGKKFSKSKSRITDSIWYINSKKKIDDDDGLPSAFTLNNIMGSLAILCFAILQVGAVAAAGVVAIQNFAANASRLNGLKKIRGREPD